MNAKHPDRFSALQVGLYFTRNRIVVPAMASQTADANGFATQKTFEHYANLVKAKAGIVMVEYTYVTTSGKSEENQLAADSDDKVEGLARIAAIIKDAGALSFLQLTHSLAKSSPHLTGGVLLGASPIAVPVKDKTMEIPREISSKEIEVLKRDFFLAAARAVKAGFIGIELHSAHGYGLNQWLSPITNQRNDSWGGTFEKRSRFLFEIVADIRAAFPRLLISVRIPGQDNYPGGLQTNDMQKVAQQLECLGVNLIDVSSGIGGWRRPRDRVGEGYLVAEASLIQDVLKIPVIGVGGIETADYIDRALEEKKFSLAAVGRAILNNPENFAARVLSCSDMKKEGATNEHNRKCYQHLFSGLYASR